MSFHPLLKVLTRSKKKKALHINGQHSTLVFRPSPSVWGDKLPFNTVCGEFSNGRGGWVHSVAFSPSGDALAFAGHDSSINVAYPSADGNHTVLTIPSNTLPFRSLIWANEQQIIAAGFDCAPILYETKDGRDWYEIVIL